MTAKPVIGEYRYQIEAYLCDFRGKATLPMLGGFMLQAATRHAEERRFGYADLTGVERVWVLMRMNIEIVEYPQHDTEIVLYTWVSEVNKMFTERCFEITSPDGVKLAFARSTWACIDLNTRRPTNILELVGLVDYVCKRDIPIASAVKIPPVRESGEEAATFTVKYSDIDINRHLNSMKYIEHIVDVFHLSFYERKEIRRFEINYLHEGQYGAQITVIRQETAPDVFVLEMRTDLNTISTARISWE